MRVSDINHHQVRVRFTGEAIIAEHRRPPHGGGVYYHVGLSDAAVQWCEERGIKPPLAQDDPTNAGFILTFEDKNAAFEFKMRWYQS